MNLESRWLLVASLALGSFACSLKDASPNPFAAETDRDDDSSDSQGNDTGGTKGGGTSGIGARQTSTSAQGGAVAYTRPGSATTASSSGGATSEGKQSSLLSGGASQRSLTTGSAVQIPSESGGSSQNGVATGGAAPSDSVQSGGASAVASSTSRTGTTLPDGVAGQNGGTTSVVGGSSGGTGGLSADSASSRRPTVPHWVTGYYVGYQSSKHPPSEIDFSGLSHLVMGAALAKADGTLDLSFYVGSATAGATLAREVAQRAHAAGKRALLMVGGAGNGSAIGAAVKNQSGAFVANLTKAVTDLGYDGLDLDWEDSVDMAQFVSLAKALRSTMPNAILTGPGFTVNPNYQKVDPATKQLVEYLDQYNLMSYYPATAMAGGGWLSWHNSPLCGQKATTPVTIEDSLKRFADIGVPKAKLGMGVAFYAICYTGGVTAPNQSTEGVTIQGGDNDFPVSELLDASAAYPHSARHWDADAQVPFLTLDAVDRRGCKYVSYDDEESLAAKGTFAKQNGYGGIIVWTISQGYLPTRAAGQRNPLMQALKQSFLD